MNGLGQTQLLAELFTPHEITDDSPTDHDVRQGVDPSANVKDTRTVVNRQIAEAAARELVRISDEIEPLLIFAWRRHVTAAITRMLADATPDEASSEPHRVVGFADLVSFTSLVRRMSERPYLPCLPEWRGRRRWRHRPRFLLRAPCCHPRVGADAAG